MKKLLRAGDPDQLRLGAHLAISLDDETIIDELLAGASYDPEAKSVRAGKAFASLPKKMRSTGILATLALIASGRGSVARDLRRRVTALRFDRTYRSRGNVCSCDPDLPFDCDLVHGLPLRELDTGGAAVNVDALAKLPELQRLVATGLGSHLGELSALRDLTTYVDAGVLPSLPGLQRLVVGSRGDELVVDCPALKTLEVSATLKRLRVHAPRLETATLRGVAELHADGPMPELRTIETSAAFMQPAHFPSLREVSVRVGRGSVPANALRGISELPAIAHLKIDVDSEERLESLKELAGVKLESFELRQHVETRLLSLEGHPHVPGPTTRRLHALQSLVGIAAAPGTATLTLGPRIESLDGIEGLKGSLRALDLQKCTALRDVSALAGMDLRVIALGDAPLKRSDLPDELRWAIVDRVDWQELDRLAQRERPSLVAPVQASALDRIQPLLRNPTFENLEKAADIVRDAADPELVDFLLERVAVRDDDVNPGRNVKGPKRTLAVRRHFTRRVIAEAATSSKRAKAVRGRIDSLRLHRPDRDQVDCPVILSPIAGFDALKSLVVTVELPLEQLQYVGSCESLERLVVAGETEDLSWLAGATRLRHVEVGPTSSLEGVEALSHLETLHTSTTVRSIAPLRAKAELASLRLAVRNADLTPLKTLPALRHLRLQAEDCDLSVLAELPLETLSLRCRHAPPKLPTTIRELELLGVDTLEGITAVGARSLRAGYVDSLHVDCTGFPSLKELDVAFVEAVTWGTLPPSIRGVSISGREGTRVELGVLAKLPELRVVRLERVACPTLDWLGGASIRAVGTQSCSLESVDGALAATELRELHVGMDRGSFDLAPLDAHPSLESIVVWPAWSCIRDQSSLPTGLRAKLASRGSLRVEDHLHVTD